MDTPTRIAATIHPALVPTFLAFSLCLGVGCGGPAPTKSPVPAATFQEDRPLVIVATTGPVGDLARRVAGEGAQVTTLMGPGVDPHLYTAVRDDYVRLERADVVLYNGLHLEGRMGEVLERLAERRPVFAVTQTLVDKKDPRLRAAEGFEGYPDPHVWHDAALWADCAVSVGESLAAFDPNSAEGYRERSQAYAAELRTLHRACKAQIATIPESNRVLVTAHDAFGYFSAAYGLESIGLKGVSTEDQVDLGHMAQVVDLLVTRKTPCVFVETAVAPKIMEALAEPCQERGHSVKIGAELYADALGAAGSGAETYVAMIRANVTAIVVGLGGEPLDWDAAGAP